MVAYVEADCPMTAITQALPWGFNRIDGNSSSTRASDDTGAVSNVNASIIDTGIDTAHLDLNVVQYVNLQRGMVDLLLMLFINGGLLSGITPTITLVCRCRSH